MMIVTAIRKKKLDKQQNNLEWKGSQNIWYIMYIEIEKVAIALCILREW